ncbi:MAG: hypothetical protein IJN42_08270 [Clostridia bacterium]|nr:hypothetical protein [Clostridia bacterium]
MVKKLFKHEILSYLRLLIPVYIALAGIAAMGRIIQFFEADTIYYSLLRGSSLIAFGLAAGVSLLLTAIFYILRFYKNCFTGEGYLTFTLPVTTGQLLFTKLAVAVLTVVTTATAIVLSTCLLFAGEWLVELAKAALYLLRGAVEYFGITHICLFAAEGLLLLLVTVIAEVLLYYTCISVGQTFRKNRILAAVGIYFAWYLLMQVVSTVFSMFFSFFMMAELPIVEQLMLWMEQNVAPTIHIFLCGYSVFMMIYGGLEYLVTYLAIRKKLNLE